MTAEQECRHSGAIKVAITSKFPLHRYTADQLGHLKVTQKWS
jgi:hypothetical protein